MPCLTVGNQLPILLISFRSEASSSTTCWESVTNPLDKLSLGHPLGYIYVGNQLPILLISFQSAPQSSRGSWESVTNPLDKLSWRVERLASRLGISYQSS